MTKKNSTKRSLLMSTLALVLCFSMLVGSTFAWFTDSVSSGGNRIVAGNLKVDLLMDKAENGAYASIANGTGDIFSEATGNGVLWEPGKTEIVYLAVKNAGTLALKYNIQLNVTDGGLVGALEYAVIDGAKAADLTGYSNWNELKAAAQTGNVAAGVTMAAPNGKLEENGNTDFFALAVHMKEEAGNEYQGKNITIDVCVVAAQLAYEEDSFGTDYYDATAQFGTYQGTGTLTVGQTAVELEAVNNGVKLASAIVGKDSVEDPTDPVQLIVIPTDEHANVTVAAGMEAKGFDISVINLKPDNTVPVKVTLKIEAGLDPATVVLYHYDQVIPCTYDPNTGYVTFESTSFSPFTVVYDAESEYVPPVVGADYPTAKVTYEKQYVNVDLPWKNYSGWAPTEGLDSQLEAAFTFACPDYDEATDEGKAIIDAYRYWYCDFFVSLNEDLGENEIFLGGNYGSFGWVGFHNGELTLKAGTELPLLSSVTTNPWTYEDVESFVGEFICGVGDVDDALDGATFTVKLRLINPEKVDTDESEWWANLAKDAYVDVNVVTYTFGGNSVIDGETVVTTAEGL